MTMAVLHHERTPDPALPASWLPSWKSFARALRASSNQGRPASERTVKNYGAALLALARFLDPAPPLEELTREQLELFLAAFNAAHASASTGIHFRGLRRFFNWLVEEGDLKVSPLARIRAPVDREEPTPILSLEAIAQLLKACEGQDFASRRDRALIRFLIDTGVRLGGMAELRLRDVDLDGQSAAIHAKGGDVYEVALGTKTVRDLDRYIRIRSQHKQASSPRLWLGQRGPLDETGIYQVVRRRAAAAGIKVSKAVHVFRHSFSHHFRMAGGDEGDLQVLGGWKSRQMLARYGKSMAGVRARAAHRRFSPGDLV